MEIINAVNAGARCTRVGAGAIVDVVTRTSTSCRVDKFLEPSLALAMIVVAMNPSGSRVVHAGATAAIHLVPAAVVDVRAIHDSGESTIRLASHFVSRCGVRRRCRGKARLARQHHGLPELLRRRAAGQLRVLAGGRNTADNLLACASRGERAIRLALPSESLATARSAVHGVPRDACVCHLLIEGHRRRIVGKCRERGHGRHAASDLLAVMGWCLRAIRVASHGPCLRAGSGTIQGVSRLASKDVGVLEILDSLGRGLSVLSRDWCPTSVLLAAARVARRLQMVSVRAMACVVVDQILTSARVAPVARSRAIIDILAGANPILTNHLLETRLALALIVVGVDSSGSLKVLASPVTTALDVERLAIVDVGASLLSSEAAIGCASQSVSRRSVGQPIRGVPGLALHGHIIGERQSALGRGATSGVRGHRWDPAGHRAALAASAEFAAGQALPLEACRISGSSRQGVSCLTLVRDGALECHAGCGVLRGGVQRWGRRRQPAADRLTILVLGGQR
mmetsp:Transcript_13807/g.34789  ORF Transcript_13807/g.34789 Transcript_13807/m.34789 type:complete len:512 (+) Transcript_13807:7905-9440(+)